MSEETKGAPPKRLLAIASSGGHWTELARLSPAFGSYDTLYATSAKGVAVPGGTRPITSITDASRSNPLRLLRTGFEVARLLLRFRPHLIVTTGAAPGLIALALGRLLGSRTLWIDSIANAEALSLSGKLARHCANARLTQWEHLASADPGLRFIGRVI
jgi:hypothetical protein